MRIIDLSLTIYEGMPTIPAAWHSLVDISILGRYQQEARASRKITVGSHTSTHVDAPNHLYPNAIGVDELDLNILIGKATILDLSYKKDLEPINGDDLDEVAGERKIEARLIVNTGWFKKWETPIFYKTHPYFTKNACQWMVDKGVKLLAIDIPSPDNPEDICYGDMQPIHDTLMSKDIIIIECLTNLDQLSQPNVLLISAPLKIKGSDGAPARIYAIEEL